jgi:hypothetical protein
VPALRTIDRIEKLKTYDKAAAGKFEAVNAVAQVVEKDGN